jgi:glycosyltransferase involved in cell wall biosynthesis
MSSNRHSHLSVNGRFLTRRMTGVERVAIELLKSIATLKEVERLTVYHPKADVLNVAWLDELPPVLRAKISIRRVGRFRGHIWEQVDLPAAASGTTLLSLCSTGPLAHRDQAVMIHDAQVWDTPDSFSLAFRVGYKLLLPILSRRSRHLLTVSRFSAKRLEDLRIAPKGKAKVVHNGADHMLKLDADLAALNRYGLQEKAYFLAIGSLAPHKNLGMLLDAASLRGPSSPELIVVGGQNSRVFARTHLMEKPGVRFLGAIEDQELRSLYSGALALAFPSKTEGFGLPPIEAMVHGCPVIATTGGAVPEICGDAALYVDPQDTRGWTVALETMAKDHRLRLELSAAGLKHAASFTWDKAAKDLMSAID